MRCIVIARPVSSSVFKLESLNGQPPCSMAESGSKPTP
jgi:hypothetical protein